MTKKKVGGKYVRDISKLLASGAEVSYDRVNKAGIRCKEYIIGGKYKLLMPSYGTRRGVLFELEHGVWIKTPLVSYACVFLCYLLDYRFEVFNLNEQENENV